VIFMMDQRKEQQVCIKFCDNLGKSAMEIPCVLTFHTYQIMIDEIIHGWPEDGFLEA
jgi:hypothetical protein